MSLYENMLTGTEVHTHREVRLDNGVVLPKGVKGKVTNAMLGDSRNIEVTFDDYGKQVVVFTDMTMDATTLRGLLERMLPIISGRTTHQERAQKWFILNANHEPVEVFEEKSMRHWLVDQPNENLLRRDKVADGNTVVTTFFRPILNYRGAFDRNRMKLFDIILTIDDDEMRKYRRKTYAEAMHIHNMLVDVHNKVEALLTGLPKD